MEKTKSNTVVGEIYESHHVSGKRLGQSFEEAVRGPLFAGWIGNSNKEVLDLGGRDGVLTKYYLDGNRVTIGDADSSALEYAKNALPQINTCELNLNEQLPFPDDHFDVVVMAEVLEHLPYPNFTLFEVHRVLKRSGIFLGSIPLAYHLIDRWKVLRGKKLTIAGDPTHLQFWRYSEAVNMLCDYFQIENIKILKGGKKAYRHPDLFARDIAFLCRKQ